MTTGSAEAEVTTETEAETEAATEAAIEVTTEVEPDIVAEAETTFFAMYVEDHRMSQDSVMTEHVSQEIN